MVEGGLGTDHLLYCALCKLLFFKVKVLQRPPNGSCWSKARVLTVRLNLKEAAGKVMSLTNRNKI